MVALASGQSKKVGLLNVANESLIEPSGIRAEGPLILFVVNELWFFRSHFLPWAKVAQADGFAVAVLATPDNGADALWAEGITVIASRSRRGGMWPEGLWAAAGQIRDVLTGRRNVVIHAFGLHGMAITALARLRGVKAPLAVSVTGLGFLATQAGPRRAAGLILTQSLRLALDGSATHWLVENSHDGPAIGLGARAGGRVTVLTGAGVDPAAFTVEALPPRTPLRLILVARLVRSKGVDLAVAAIREARRRGADVTLTVVGEPDAANPASCPPDELARFAATPGVSLLGRRSDIPELLASHHLFILPSRGGEGLPRALLEAAAAGRAAIVSAVPGCKEFVADGVNGFLVPPEDIESLAEAILQAAAAEPEALAAMGNEARARVERSASLAIITDQVTGVYRHLLAAQA